MNLIIPNYCLGLASKEFYTNRRFGTAVENISGNF